MLAGLVDESFSRENSPPLTPLDAFRTKAPRLKIHPVEMATLWAVAIHLVFLPWALGTMWPWTQIVSLGLATIGFVCCLLPRTYTQEHTRAAPFRMYTARKLIRFPVFWLGLLLLGYIATQALNPAWTYETNGHAAWMRRIDFNHWLPRGVEAPFARYNPWRMLIIYSATWLTVCTVWVAFTRRRTVQLLLITLGINGVLLAAFGIVQRVTGNGKIYWFVESTNVSFFSTFVYKNHAAAYLLLTLIVTCGLAAWYYIRGLRRMEKSNPSGVLAFFATFIAVSILTSYARGATLTMLVFLLVCIVGFLIHQLRQPSENRRPVVMIVLMLVFGFFLKVGSDALRTKEAWDRIRAGVMRQDTALAAREKATEAAAEMLREQWRFGVGSGAFRHLFSIYQHRHPDLVATPDGRRQFWEHAHNDVIQFPIELGAFGTAVIAASFGFYLLRLVRSYFWENPLSTSVVFGGGLLVAYAWFDFPFQNPAVLITWAILWPIATMWAQFEEAGNRS
jgi:O-antigen ligase